MDVETGDYHGKIAWWTRVLSEVLLSRIEPFIVVYRFIVYIP